MPQLRFLAACQKLFLYCCFLLCFGFVLVESCGGPFSRPPGASFFTLVVPSFSCLLSIGFETLGASPAFILNEGFETLGRRALRHHFHVKTHADAAPVGRDIEFLHVLAAPVDRDIEFLRVLPHRLTETSSFYMFWPHQLTEASNF